MYQAYFDKAAKYLPFTEDKNNQSVAKLLVLGSLYGAGDALAGSLLRKVPLSFIESVAKALSLSQCRSAAA